MSFMAKEQVFAVVVLLLSAPAVLLATLKETKSEDKQTVIAALEYYESRLKNYDAQCTVTLEYESPYAREVAAKIGGPQDDAFRWTSASIHYIWEGGQYRSEEVTRNPQGKILLESWKTLNKDTLVVHVPQREGVPSNSLSRASIQPKTVRHEAIADTAPNRFMLTDQNGRSTSAFLREDPNSRVYGVVSDGRELVACEWHYRGYRFVAHLDPAQKYTLVREAIYLLSPTERLVMTLDNVVWKDLGNDAMFPISGDQTSYSLDRAAGELRKLRVWRLKVAEETIKLNQELDASVFTIQLPAGTTVIDDIAGLTYVVGSNKAVDSLVSEPNSGGILSQAAGMRPASRTSSRLLFWTFLVATGIAGIAVLCAIRRRHLHSTKQR
jgi:hypothetical protein